jgi:hypothetical protein
MLGSRGRLIFWRPGANSQLGGLMEADLTLPIVEFPWACIDAILRQFKRLWGAK